MTHYPHKVWWGREKSVMTFAGTWWHRYLSSLHETILFANCMAKAYRQRAPSWEIAAVYHCLRRSKNHTVPWHEKVMMIRGQHFYSLNVELQFERLLATLEAKKDRDSINMLHMTHSKLGKRYSGIVG